MELMNVTQTAEYLGLSRQGVYNFIRSGVIPYIKLSRFVRFDKADLDAYLASRKVLSNSQKNELAEQLLKEKNL